MELYAPPHNAGNRSRFKRWQSTVRGNVYRDTSDRYILTQASEYEQEIPEEKSWYRVRYGRYWQFYIAHYDPGKYKEQMTDYKEGKRKSRPNGRRECKLRNSDWHFFGLHIPPNAFLPPPPLHET